MSYIGKTPTVGNFVKLDAITTSSTNTYNLLNGGVAFTPESANHMIVSLNGVIQAPNTAFSVSGSTITFLPSSGTLSSSDSIDFIMVLGNVLDVGVASTVTDNSITKAKMNLISDSSSAGLTIKGDGSSENGTLQLNCSANSHGVKVSSPAHSAGQSYELILPTGNVTAGKFLKVASVSGSGVTGIGQLSFADAGGGILQVKSTSSTTSTSSYSTSYSNNGVSGLSITPASSSNKILVLYSVANYINTTTSASVAMFRDSTNIITNSVIGGYFTSSAIFLDDPQSTSSLTYQLKHKLNSSAGGTYIYSQANGSTSSLTLMEISSSIL